MHYFFRTNLNSKVGLGHFSRIQFFIKLFGNKKCTIVIDKVNKKIKEKYKKVKILGLYNKETGFKNQLDDAKKFKSILYNKTNSIIIVDDYRLNFKWEKELYNHGKKIICIDDFIDRKHYSDFYINTKPDLANIPDSKRNIIEKNNKKNCKLLLGPEYCLINPILRKKKRTIKNFSITFYNGGSGSILIYQKLIDRLIKKNSKKLTMNLVLGPLSKNHKKINKKFKQNINLNLVRETNDLSHIFSNTDLLISSAGLVTFESAFFKIPTILINMSQNQKSNQNGLEKIGHYIYLNKKDLKKTQKFYNLILVLLKNYIRFKKLTRNNSIQIKNNSKKISKILDLNE